MGADMTLAVVQVWGDVDLDEEQERLLKQIEDARLENISLFWMEASGDDCDLEKQFSLHRITEEEEEEVEDVLKNAREAAAEVIKEVFKLLKDWDREVCTFKVKDVEIFASGGMSHGDSPTDAYDAFSKYSMLIDSGVIRSTKVRA